MGSILINNSEECDESCGSFFGGDVTSLREQILQLEASFCSSDITGCSHCEKSLEADCSHSSADVPDYIQGDNVDPEDDKRRPRHLGRSSSHISDSTNGSFAAKSDHSALKSRPSLMRKASQRAMNTLMGFTGISSRNLQTEDHQNLLLEGHDVHGKDNHGQRPVDDSAVSAGEERAPGRRGLLSRMRSRMAVHDDSGEVAEKPDRRPSLNRTASLCFRTKFSRSMSSENVASQQETADYSALGDDTSICSAEDGALQLSRSHVVEETPSCGSSASSDMNKSALIAQFEIKLPEDRPTADAVDQFCHSIHRDVSKRCDTSPGEVKPSKMEYVGQVQSERIELGQATSKRKPKRATSSNRLERSSRRQLNRSRSGQDSHMSNHAKAVKEKVDRSSRSSEGPRRTFAKSRVRRAASSSLVELSSTCQSQLSSYDSISRHCSRRGATPHGSSRSKGSSRRSTVHDGESTKCSGGTDRDYGEVQSRKSSGCSRSPEKKRHSPRTNKTSSECSSFNETLRHSSRKISSRGGERARSSRSSEHKRHRSEHKSHHKRASKESRGVIGDSQPLSDDSITCQGLVAQSA